MTTRHFQLLLVLAAAGCASAPASRPLPPDLPPLPRSSIVAVLAHRGELELSDAQAETLAQADVALQQTLLRLRAEGAPAASPPDGPGPMGPGPGGGPPTGPVGAAGARPGAGLGMNAGPGGLQLAPNAGGMGGPGGAGPPGSGGAHGAGTGQPAGAPRRNPAREQEALDARLDDADTAAFLKVEPVLSPAQRERAREIANGYREQAFERRELLRGR